MRATQGENGAQAGEATTRAGATESSRRGDKKAENSNINSAGFKERSN